VPGTLTTVAPKELSIGNEVAGSPTQIKLKLLCGGAEEKKATGKLLPKIENGSSLGSAPMIEEFVAGPTGGELTIGAGKATVSGKLKTMAFGEGQFLSIKAP
jgi:hypothetical protein